MEPSGLRIASTALDDRVLADIRKQLAEGNKIAAIKTLRTATGLDLTAAKNAVEAIGAGAARRTDKFELTGADGERIKAALLAGKNAEAVRLFRDAAGADLKTAPSAIEAYAQHLEAGGAAPTSTSSTTIKLGPTITRGSGRAFQIAWAIAVIALLGFMLWKFTL
ncbi:MAG: ribosomal protein L7/L12 [Alphaproteobacteria bacterium]|nr:ribosomal protein L7/L12 [Alphaproteobacteria bacterium]